MAAIRTLWTTVFGAVLGFALGIAAPLALFALMYWENPDGMRYGGATPFALLLPFSAIACAALGAAYGYSRRNAHPKSWLAEFRTQFGTYAVEDQRIALAQVLPEWLNRQKRRMLFDLICCTAIGLVTLPNGRLGIIILVVIAGVTLVRIVRMRAVLAGIRKEWGDEALASIEPLPFWLRPLSTRNDWQG